MNEPDLFTGINYVSVVTRYERFLAIHLIDSVQVLQTQSPDLCEQSDFRENWLLVEHLPADILFQAAAQPLLGSWLRTHEALTLVRTYARYPNGHAVRHLKDFARILLSWIGSTTPNAHGSVSVLGRQVFPLLGGERLLMLKERIGAGKLLWQAENQVLKIALPEIGTIAEVDLADPHRSDTLDSHCFLITPPVLDGLRLDVWTPEFGGDCGYESSRKKLERFQPLLRHAIGQLSSEQKQFVTSLCQCVTVNPELSWIAGLINLSESGSELTAESLVELACRDFAQRVLRITPIALSAITADVPGGGPAVIRLFAKRLTARIFGKEISAGEDRTWQRLRSALRSAKHGERLLVEFGEDALMGSLPHEPSGRIALSLADVLQRAGIKNMSPLTLRKTSVASNAAVDWGALDSLALLSSDDLAMISEQDLDDPNANEANAYSAAVICYLQGRFRDSQKYLLTCLGFDGDVEEYWHLLAFTFRHLGEIAEFDRIIFTRERNLSTVQSRLLKQDSVSSGVA